MYKNYSDSKTHPSFVPFLFRLHTNKTGPKVINNPKLNYNALILTLLILKSLGNCTLPNEETRTFNTARVI